MTQKEIRLFINFVYPFRVNKFAKDYSISKDEYKAMKSIARWLYKNKVEVTEKEMMEAIKKHPLLNKAKTKEL